MGMVARALNDTANVRLAAKATVLTGLTDRLVLVLCVSDFTHRCTAGVVDHSHFATGKPKSNITALFSHHLSRSPRGTDPLAAFVGLKLDIVN
jgi:hypothetical protein